MKQTTAQAATELAIKDEQFEEQRLNHLMQTFEYVWSDFAQTEWFMSLTAEQQRYGYEIMKRFVDCCYRHYFVGLGKLAPHMIAELCQGVLPKEENIDLGSLTAFTPTCIRFLQWLEMQTIIEDTRALRQELLDVKQTMLNRFKQNWQQQLTAIDYSDMQTAGAQGSV